MHPSMIWSGSRGLVSLCIVINPVLDVDPVTAAVVAIAADAAARGRKKKGGGLTFCRAVGSAGVCCRGCLSPPLLQTMTLTGPSWAAVGASLCARSCS